MAGRLAELLEVGGPCPTCGATTHPNPAVLHPDAPDDDALEKVEKASEATLVILRNVERRHAEVTGQLEGMPPRRDRFALTDELGLCKSQLKEAEEAVIKKTQLETEHAKRTEQLDTRREAIDKEDHQLATDEAVLAAQATAVAEEKREFEETHGNFTSPAPIAESLRSLVSALDVLGTRQGQQEEAELRLCNLQATLAPVLAELGLEDPAALLELVLRPVVIAERERRLQERRDRREAVRRRIAEYEQAEHPTTRPDPEPLLAAATVAESRHRDLIGCQAVIVEQAGILNAGPGRLKDADHNAAAARQAFEQAKTLADQCAGLGTGASASRLSLENWVLSDYLRQVLLQANERLAIMTDGRYELRLDEGVTDGRRAWGLDIAAFDANTGQVRPATTFSGGETFMAALSLALGLADVVSGGSNHNIGALFVDEGFGSLDPESLDLTLDVLRSLEDGGRIVGVISHVEDMKLALPNGITIETSPNGSVAQVNYPLV
jgi:exonuclease SbcC